MATSSADPSSTPHGTVVPDAKFNAEAEAQMLRNAMKGMGTDEKAIIGVVSQRTAEQLIQVEAKFKVLFGRDLKSDLKSELGGNMEELTLALFHSKLEFDAVCLRKAMKGAGTDEDTLIDILATRTNQEIQNIKASYTKLYSKNLENDIGSETSGDFKRLLISLCQGGREENMQVDMEKAKKEAKDLYDAGEGQWGTDESRFNQILALRSFPQLRATFDEYKNIAHRDIATSIEKEMSGNLKKGMLAIVGVVSNPPAYFAKRLYQSMKGAGTNDELLIRIVVSRCERDMVEIKNEFMKAYQKSLEANVKDDTSGDYEKLLLALIT